MVSWTTTVSADMIPQNGYGSVEYADKDITISPTAVTLDDYEYEWNGEEYVDLGLSFHVATCNIGANSPEEDGGLYMWASVTDNSNSLCYWDDCPDVKKWDEETETLTFSYYKNTGATLLAKDDIVYVTKGSDWRMPTASHFTTLKKNTYQKVAKYKGKEGIVLISKKNGKAIFMPRTPMRYAGSNGTGTTGSYTAGSAYWCKTQSGLYDWGANALLFDYSFSSRKLTGSVTVYDSVSRCHGLAVRGVKLYNL